MRWFLFFIGLTFFSSVFSVYAQPIESGEFRSELNLNDFEFQNVHSDFKISLIPNSLEWMRMDGMLLPRVRVEIEVLESPENYVIEYDNALIHFNTFAKHRLEFYYSLYEGDSVKIIKNNTIRELNLSIKSKSGNLLRDYSCSRYFVEIKGLEGEFGSYSCELIHSGNIGSEVSKLRVRMVVANAKSETGKIYRPTFILGQDEQAFGVLVDSQNKKRKFSVSAKVNNRFQRLKTALGVGPYQLDVNSGSDRRISYAPSGMVYGNFYLGPQSSFRFFEALVVEKSIFNNLGLYFAYDLARFYDNRFQLVALLGLQTVSFKYNSDLFNQFIFPQGAELVYHHAFGLENYSMVLGAFLLPSRENPYQNFWVRFGTRIFAELNYIHWKKREKKATMWGISGGFPFLNFF